jgi:endogenous inhibitor of DNA gyrase (YacG/DUF329 family)
MVCIFNDYPIPHRCPTCGIKFFAPMASPIESLFCSKKCETDALVWDLGKAMAMIKELNSLGRKQSENDISDAMAQAMFWIREKQNQQ